MKGSYLSLYEQGKLKERISLARGLLSPCRLCPRRCGVDRLQPGELGVCRTGERALVASFGPHFGEESPLVGTGGSGTIFFSRCNLLCIFCQNYDISHCPQGEEGVAVEPEELARIMVGLQDQGCHNVNFVTPTHVMPQILAALPPAIEMGLHLPLVYNSSGYDSVDSLQLLEGIVDIYMPDFKFWDPDHAKTYAHAEDYPGVAKLALKEMHRQVGDLVIDDSGLARRGLLIRHLVMPGCLDETEAILNFIATEISPDSYVNVMDQYRPCGKAGEFEGLDRTLTGDEYHQAKEMAKRAGLTRLDEKDFTLFLKKLGIG